MTSYVLLVTIVAHGVSSAVSTQERGQFSSYERCVEASVGEVETLHPLYPDAEIEWRCVPR
jgi:hypothetical protein